LLCKCYEFIVTQIDLISQEQIVPEKFYHTDAPKLKTLSVFVLKSMSLFKHRKD